MSDIDTDERAAKRSALDAFAQAPPRQEVSAQVMPMPATERVFGAQQVAVHRDDQRVLQKLAALGAAAGDDWFYRYPVKSKTGQKSFIEGPSIKLANDLSRVYGNCSIDVRVMDLGSSWLIYARFMDFETGYEMTRPFQQTKGGSKLGGDDDARRLDIAFQIGVSKAIRNVTVNALQTFADHAYDAARNSLVDKIGKDVQSWRERMKVRLSERGVELQRVEYVMGRAVADWTAPDIAKVIALMKSIGDGMATLDEVFPPKDRQTREDVDADTGEVTEGAIAMAATETADVKTPPTSEAGPPAGGEAPASPAEQSAAPSQSASAASAVTPAAAASDAGPSKAAANEAAKAPAVPKTEAEYVVFAERWIAALVDAEKGAELWKLDKTLRNKANVSEEVRENLKAKLDAKVAEIRDADRN